MPPIKPADQSHYRFNHRAKPRVFPQDFPEAGGGTCPHVHVIYIEGVGTGSSDFSYTIPNRGSDTVTINHDDDAATIKAAFQAHAHIETDEVDVKGGDLPNKEIHVHFLEALKTTSIAFPTITQNLSNNAAFRMRSLTPARLL